MTNAIAVLHATFADVVFDRDRVVRACRAPYPGHRDGCPNVGKCIHPTVDLSPCVEILVYVCRVDFAALRRKYGNPKLNLRWWQGTAKAQLRELVDADYQDGDVVLACGSGFMVGSRHWPSAEACGVLLLDDGEKRGTLSRLGVEYQRNPVDFAIMVAMLGNVGKPVHGQGRLL